MWVESLKPCLAFEDGGGGGGGGEKARKRPENER